jgi:hypothetical protein
LGAPLLRLALGCQNAVHRALGAQVGTFVQQGGVDLGRCGVTEALGMEQRQHGPPFVPIQRSRR